MIFRVAKGKAMTRGDNKRFEEGDLIPAEELEKVDVEEFIRLGYLERVEDNERD